MDTCTDTNRGFIQGTTDISRDKFHRYFSFCSFVSALICIQLVLGESAPVLEITPDNREPEYVKRINLEESFENTLISVICFGL